MQCGGGEVKGREEKDSEASHKGEERESYQKENVESIGTGAEEEKEGRLNSLDTYRGKQLPPGMKVKKRVSDEEAKSEEKVGDKMQDKTKESQHEQREAEKTSPTSSVKAAHSKKINQTLQDPHKDQQPTGSEPCQEEQTDPTVKESVSKSAPSSSANAARHSDNTNKLTQPESSQTKNHDDDDDDVVLVSVKPATEKTPPVSTVQKTLTTFPGFQLASKVKGQMGDPKGLHSLLTAQLQQKKVSD